MRLAQRSVLDSFIRQMRKWGSEKEESLPSLDAGVEEHLERSLPEFPLC